MGRCSLGRVCQSQGRPIADVAGMSPGSPTRPPHISDRVAIQVPWTLGWSVVHSLFGFYSQCSFIWRNRYLVLGIIPRVSRFSLGFSFLSFPISESSVQESTFGVSLAYSASIRRQTGVQTRSLRAGTRRCNEQP